MPCEDISELLDMRFDAEDRLLSYSLNKLTCGADIGSASLLMDAVAAKTPEGIEGLTGEDLRQQFRISNKNEFLYFKHLVALQRASRVLRGEATGGPEEACAVESVAYENGVSLKAVIRIDALTDEIRACGHCGSCGAKKPA